MPIGGKTSTAANAITRFHMDSSYTIDTDPSNNLGESDYNNGQHAHMTMVLSQSLLDNTDLGMKVF